MHQKAKAIKILDPQIARRLAAGEVIDRPAAVLRELLDNSIDASASEINCYITAGGSELISVVDNGTGMSASDLELSILPHATSKLERLEDLESLSTLGFRGEALSSIAACSRLEITTAPQQGKGQAFRLIVHGGNKVYFGPSEGKAGTRVEVADLFFNLPARKRFLKRIQTEGNLCRTIFIEKAISFPDITFRLWNNKALEFYFAATTRLERVKQAYPELAKTNLLLSHQATYGRVSFEAVLGLPELAYRDRRYIQIFVNNRRIYDFGLSQAVEYGYTGYLASSLRPIAFIFMNIDPRLVDFNIHPAKREVRFRDYAKLHSSLVLFIKDFLALNYKLIQATFSYDGDASRLGTSVPCLMDFEDAHHFTSAPELKRSVLNGNNETLIIDKLNSTHILPSANKDAQNGFYYLGQIFKTYLAAIVKGEIVIVDQHAAHERLLFDRLISAKTQKISLTLPLSLEAEADETKNLLASLEKLNSIGFEIIQEKKDSFLIKAIPDWIAELPSIEIISFLKSFKGTEEDLKREAISLLACKQALKAQEVLDELSASELIKKTLSLPEPICPHGRPVLIRISESLLAKLFKRLI